jgi:ankyrin repeat and LEM domain-containing protein 1
LFFITYFQNVIPCEAFTREAAMIDAIGLKHLTNAQKSNYYACTSVWPLSKKKQLGVLLLKKACNIFISEGERQIKPIDI